MKLTIGNQPIAINDNVVISIETTSPLLGSGGNSFSYPFPIPRLPNQQALGDPGKLERIWGVGWTFADGLWAAPAPAFILEDQGVQILTGEIEFDDINDNEIGVILKAGATDFWFKSKDIKMWVVDYGSEGWLGNETTWALFEAKRDVWQQYNATENSPVIAVRFLLDNFDKTAEELGNDWNFSFDTPEDVPFMLQFRAWYLVEKIFEHFGYTIITNDLKNSEFAQLIVFTRPIYFNFSASQEVPGELRVLPPVYTLNYKELMPDINIQDFLDGIKSVAGLVFQINDQNKEVRITSVRDLFSPENIDLMPIPELRGLIHREHVKINGFQLSYQTQDDQNDTKIASVDYNATVTVEDTLPPATIEDQVVHVNSVNRDYIAVKNSNDLLYWSMIGRLKPYISAGSGVEAAPYEVVATPERDLKIEFPVKVPKTHSVDETPHPYLPVDRTIQESMPWSQEVIYLKTNKVSELYVSLYRGIVGVTLTPMICAEKYAPDAYPSLEPVDLYENVYKDYLIWKSTDNASRGFTKYIQLTLPQLLSLRWDKRYVISGNNVVFEKINYELPFRGIVKVDGYTV